MRENRGVRATVRSGSKFHAQKLIAFRFISFHRIMVNYAHVTITSFLLPSTLPLATVHHHQRQFQATKPAPVKLQPLHNFALPLLNGVRTTSIIRNRLSLPLKPPPLHEAEHDNTDNSVHKPWNLRLRKPHSSPRPPSKSAPDLLHPHHSTSNNNDNNNPALKCQLRGHAVHGLRGGNSG